MNDSEDGVRTEYRERLLATDTSRRLRMMAGMSDLDLIAEHLRVVHDQ